MRPYGTGGGLKDLCLYLIFFDTKKHFSQRKTELQSLLLVYLNVVFGGCRVFSVLFMNCVSVRGK
jgi:hypothetical protein